MATKTPTLHKLTWHKARQCWKKQYQGKIYYLSKSGECKGQGDIDGRNKALRKWLEIYDRLTADPDPQNLPKKATLETLIDHSVAMADYRALRAKRATKTAIAAAAPPDTIAGLIHAYVSGRRIEAESGQRSMATYMEAKTKLDEFAKYCLESGLTKVDELTASVLEDYQQCQLLLTDPSVADPSDLIGKITCQKRLARVKQFIVHAWEQGYLPELPRNIKRFAKVSLKGEVLRVKRLGFFTVEECRAFYDSAYHKNRLTGQVFQRTRLYVCLALNCGFTQRDIATLEHEHIDWDKGMIVRPRHKTQADQRHVLWPVTQKHLKAELSDPTKHKLALIGQKGNSLLTESIKDDGLLKQTNTVKLAFDRLKKKLKLEKDPRGFSIFRKTGANLLKQKFGNEVTDLYLAHTTKAMRKNYVDETYDAYFEALDWLGKHLALGSK